MKPEEVREKQNQLMKIKQEKDKLLEKYSDGDYDLQRITTEICFYLVQNARGIIEIGKRLIIVREQEGYGSFVKWIEDNFPFSKTTAYRWMNAVSKLANYTFPTMGNLKPGKVYFLLEDISEDELKELEQSGSIAGIEMDNIDKLSRKEMKERLQRYRNQLDEGKKQLEKVEQENERLRGKDISEIPDELKVNKLEEGMIHLIGAMQKLHAQAKERPKEERMEAGKFLKTFSLWTSRITGIINPTGIEWEPVEDDYYERKQDEAFKAEQSKS